MINRWNYTFSNHITTNLVPWVPEVIFFQRGGEQETRRDKKLVFFFPLRVSCLPARRKKITSGTHVAKVSHLFKGWNFINFPRPWKQRQPTFSWEKRRSCTDFYVSQPWALSLSKSEPAINRVLKIDRKFLLTGLLNYAVSKASRDCHTQNSAISLQTKVLKLYAWLVFLYKILVTRKLSHANI